MLIPLIIMILNFSIDYRQLFSSRSPFIERLVDQLDETNLSYNINMPERKIVKNRIERLNKKSKTSA